MWETCFPRFPHATHVLTECQDSRRSFVAHRRRATATTSARPPTIRDVARAAGVSVGTASKALNDRGRLRPETRERVRAEAERLEFRPNDLIKSLLRGRTFTVGLITTDYFGRFNMPVIAGIEDALGSAEILVFLCNVRDDPERERKVISALLAKKVDGIIVMGRSVDPRPPINVGQSGPPVVYAFSRVPDPAALCLLPDDAQGARLATEHLLRLGRRQLAHITGPADREAVVSRQEGMSAVLQEHGHRLAQLARPVWRVDGGMGLRRRRAAARAGEEHRRHLLRQRHHRPRRARRSARARPSPSRTTWPWSASTTGRSSPPRHGRH